MKVTVGAILGVRRLLGWHEKEMAFPGGTLADLLKALEVPGGSNLYKLLVMDDGSINPKYMFALNQKIIDQEDLNTPIQEGDRLVLMDKLHMPSLYMA